MDALTIASISMQDDLQQLQTVSQNLSNVSTPAYKREIHVSRAFEAMMAQSEANALDAGTKGGGDIAVRLDTVLDTGIGAVRATNNPLDVALQSKGFFEVTTGNGVAYTRQGAFRLDSSGRMTTASGDPLSGVNGELHVNGTNFTIDNSGKLMQDGKSVGQIKVVQISEPQLMQPMGGGMFALGGAKVAESSAVTNMQTGYLEASNVSSPQEMVKLTETVRHFESMQRVFQGYDDVFQKTISKLGDF